MKDESGRKTITKFVALKRQSHLTYLTVSIKMQNAKKRRTKAEN